MITPEKNTTGFDKANAASGFFFHEWQWTGRNAGKASDTAVLFVYTIPPPLKKAVPRAPDTTVFLLDAQHNISCPRRTLQNPHSAGGLQNAALSWP